MPSLLVLSPSNPGICQPRIRHFFPRNVVSKRRELGMERGRSWFGIVQSWFGIARSSLGFSDPVLGFSDPVLGLPNPGLGLPPGIPAHPGFLMFTPALLPSFPQGLVPRARCDPGAHPHPEHPEFWEVIPVPAWLFPFPHSRLEQGSVDVWNPRGLCWPHRSGDF